MTAFSRFKWKSARYNVGAQVSKDKPVGSGTFPDVHLPPSKLANYVARMTGSRIVRGSYGAEGRITALFQMCNAKNVPAILYKLPNQNATILIDIGHKWGGLAVEMVKFSNFDWSVTVISKNGLHSILEFWPNCQRTLQPDQSWEDILRISSNFPVQLIAVHTEGAGHDDVVGICLDKARAALPPFLAEEFEWVQL